MGRVVLGLGSQKAHPLGQGAVVGDEGAAAAGGQNLVAIEGKHAHPAEAAQRLQLPAGAQGFGRVFQHRNVEFLCQGQ